jgi:fatty acid-binding protein DegV
MIKITADSTCDLTDEILKTMNITLVPLFHRQRTFGI